MQHFHSMDGSTDQTSNSCPLCSGQNFALMLNRALYDRYLSNVNLYFTDAIDQFIEEEITPETCKFRQKMCDIDDEELLKRDYAAHEYPGKIQMLSEYYKFHRDIPKIFEKSVFKILSKYFDRLRHYDYKKIKCVLKEEQGISLTTQKSDESSVYSDQIKKSKYSTVLYELDQNSQSESQILHNFCQKVDKAFQNVKFKNDFKGQYYSGEKKFQEYLLNAKKPQHKNHKPQFTATNPNLKMKNYNLLHQPLSYQNLNSLTLRTDKAESRKKSLKKKGHEALLQTNKALKQSLKNFKKIKNKTKSIEKTTANQTISRDEKSRRMDKLQRTLELEIEKNQNQTFKPFTAGLMGLKSNIMLQTLEQIYKPVSSVHQKYHSDKSAKNSQQQSTHNLQKIYENKLSGRRSESKNKSKPVSQHNSKEIQAHLNNKEPVTVDLHLNQQETERPSLKRQEQMGRKSSSHKKLVRSKSTSKTTLQTNIKSSQKNLQTIDYPMSEKRGRSKSTQKHEVELNQRLSNFMRHNENVMTTESKLKKQMKERTSSKKDLNSTKKEGSTSKKSLKSIKKMERSESKSHVTSARSMAGDRRKFQTIDPEANKNIDHYLERKLTIVQQPQSKQAKAKFYN